MGEFEFIYIYSYSGRSDIFQTFSNVGKSAFRLFMYIDIHLFIYYTKTYVGTHQCQRKRKKGKKSEESEGKGSRHIG